MNPGLGCQEAVSLLTEVLEQAVPPNRQTLVRRHLRACPDCRTLLADLEALPAIIQRFAPLDEGAFYSIGETALANVLGQLGKPHPAQRLIPSPIPPAVLNLLRTAADLPLRLLSLTREAMLSGTAPRSEPFLPDEVLAQLPPRKDWTWRQTGYGIRKALLWAEAKGSQLFLMYVPPRLAIPAHIHLGSESLLVLDGEMEDGDRFLTDGDWIHMELGSSHGPCVLASGCWCLVREEGDVRYCDPQDRFQGPNGNA